jgi:hypothetical protein
MASRTIGTSTKRAVRTPTRNNTGCFIGILRTRNGRVFDARLYVCNDAGTANLFLKATRSFSAPIEVDQLTQTYAARAIGSLLQLIAKSQAGQGATGRHLANLPEGLKLAADQACTVIDVVSALPRW